MTRTASLSIPLLAAILLGTTGCVTRTSIQRLTVEKIDHDKISLIAELEDTLETLKYDSVSFYFVVKPVDSVKPSEVPAPGESRDYSEKALWPSRPEIFQGPGSRLEFFGDEDNPSTQNRMRLQEFGVLGLGKNQEAPFRYRMILPLKQEDRDLGKYDFKRGEAYLFMVNIHGFRAYSGNTLDSNVCGIRIDLPP